MIKDSAYTTKMHSGDPTQCSSTQNAQTVTCIYMTVQRDSVISFLYTSLQTHTHQHGTSE